MNKNKVICGPCSAETREQILETAKWLTSLGLNECLINPQINDQKREEIKTFHST